MGYIFSDTPLTLTITLVADQLVHQNPHRQPQASLQEAGLQEAGPRPTVAPITFAGGVSVGRLPGEAAGGGQQILDTNSCSTLTHTPDIKGLPLPLALGFFVSDCQL